MNCRVILAVALLFCTLAPPAGAVATFTPLGDLPGGSFNSIPNAVSDDGAVIVGTGQSAAGSEAFRWTSGGGMVGLGDLAGGSLSSQAYGVSANGSVVVGIGSSASGSEAFRWTSGGGMVGLGDLPGGSFGSQAYGVSADGSVVVGGGSSASGSEAFRWTSGGGMVGLGDLAGGSFSAEAYSVSADGSVVVGRGTSASGSEAFRWTSGGGMVGLGDLPGGTFSSDPFFGISADGAIVVGQSNSASGFEAFRWTSAGGMVGLGDLPGGTFSSAALGVSDNGSAVVGVSDSASGFVAMIWDTNSGMQSLQSVLAADFGISLPGWNLRSATAISSNGRDIVGWGINPSAQTEAWRVDFNGSITARWGAATSGNWEAGANWKWGLNPLPIDNVEITPTNGLTVNGPTAATTIASLNLGATTSGVAELRPQTSLTATSGITVQTAGRVVLTGQLLDAGTGLTIDGAGTVQGYGVIFGPIGGTAGLAGIVLPTRSLVLSEPLAVGNRQARVLSVGFANLGPDVSIAGGTINAPKGLFLQGASNFTGSGTVNGKISAGFGSTITATGNLTLGDVSSVTGFTSDGELYTGANSVTINDVNEAVLGSLTSLGNGVSGGALVAGSAMAGDTDLHFLVEAGKNVVGRGTVGGNVKNNGHVIGDGTALAERMVFDAGWTASGIGDFQNVLFNGTFAPGLSPGVTTGANQAFGGVIEIELGGTTPGMGSGHHDQILDQATVGLVDGVDLKILPWNGFVPTLGDTFEILRWAGDLDGAFDELLVDPYFTDLGIEFELLYAADSLSLLAVAAGLAGDFNADGIVDTADYAVWRNGLGSTYTQADYNTWRANFGATAPRGGSSTSTAAPEPDTALLVVIAAIGMTLAQRRHTRREAIE